jgi:hypothetical protein
MSIKCKLEKLSMEDIQRGSIGNFFVYAVMILLIVLAFSAIGGLPLASYTPQDATPVEIIMPTPGGPTHSALQMQTFGYITPTPTKPQSQ